MTDTTQVTLPGGRREPVRLANLSAGGARVQSSFPLSVHGRITLLAPLGAGARYSLEAQVIYCKRDAHTLHYFGGLSFLQANRDGIPQISAFIEEEQRRRSGAGEMWRG